jgi:hypothetical protein
LTRIFAIKRKKCALTANTASATTCGDLGFGLTLTFF